jgi:hypothetical protein
MEAIRCSVDISNLFAISASFTPEARNLQAAVPAYLALVLFQVASQVTKSVMPILGLFLLFRRSGWTPTFFRFYLAFLIIDGVIRMSALRFLYPAIVAAFRAAGDSLVLLDAAVDEQFFEGLREAGYGGVWLAYWLRSARVSQRFGHGEVQYSASAIIPPVPARGPLATKMTELIGVPVTAVARLNVVWLDTLLGFGAITTVFAFVQFGDSPLTFSIILACTCVFEVLAWVGLRNLGGALRLGITGGVAAVSGPTLYVASASLFTSNRRKCWAAGRARKSSLRV